MGTNLCVPSLARNIGMENAEGEFIAFLDDDDLWHSYKKLEKQMLVMMNDSSIDMVTTDYRSITPEGKHIRVFPRQHTDDLWNRLLFVVRTT